MRPHHNLHTVPTLQTALECLDIRKRRIADNQSRSRLQPKPPATGCLVGLSCPTVGHAECS
jgi:hypothetical protein